MAELGGVYAAHRAGDDASDLAKCFQPDAFIEEVRICFACGQPGAQRAAYVGVVQASCPDYGTGYGGHHSR